MAHHVAIAYPDHARATEVIAALKRLEAEGVVELKKAVAIIHERERQLRVGAVIAQMIVGMLAGSGVGAILGLAFSDLWLGILIGTIVGALSGLMIAFARSEEPHTYGFGSFGQQAAERLPDGGAAVLMLVHKNDPETAIATLQQYGGTVLHTTLPAEVDTQLRAAVSTLPRAA